MLPKLYLLWLAFLFLGSSYAWTFSMGHNMYARDLICLTSSATSSLIYFLNLFGQFLNYPMVPRSTSAVLTQVLTGQTYEILLPKITVTYNQFLPQFNWNTDLITIVFYSRISEQAECIGWFFFFALLLIQLLLS